MITASSRPAVLAVASVAVATLLAACGSSSGTSGTSADSGETIQVAEQTVLSGENAQLGVETGQGIDLGINEINAAGGIDGKQIELTPFDDKCEATQAAAVANRVTSSGNFVAVIGNICSGATTAALPIYQRAGTAVLASTTSLPELSQKGFTNFARVVASDAFQAAQVAKLAVVGLGAQKVALLYSNDDLGQSIASITKDTVEQEGGQLVASESYTTGKQPDFSALLSNIAAADPDALILGGYYADMGAAVKQSARAFGDNPPLLVGGGQLQSPDFLELAGDAANGVYLSTLYDSSNPSEVNQAFVKNYQAAYGELPGVQAALGYATAQIFGDALKAAKGDYANLIDQIKQVKYEGPIGKVEFDANGDNIAGSTVVVRVENGAFVVDPDLSAKAS